MLQAGCWLGAALLVLCLATGAQAQSLAQKKSQAAAQFERAERARAALEAKPAARRAESAYHSLVASYRRVYFITPHAVEATAALLAIGALYQEMGARFNPKHYQSAIDAYQFLIHEYPGSKHAEETLLTVGRLQLERIRQLDAAELTYQAFLKRFPRSPRAAQARQALEQIAAARDQQRTAEVRAEVVRQEVQGGQRPLVQNIRHWNERNYTRIVVDLESEVKFQAARIGNPDRIYFDLYPAKLGRELSGARLPVAGGYLKGIRVAQNQAGVVRVVLEVDNVKDYSVFLLQNPVRLVVDAYGESGTMLAESRLPVAAEEKPPAGAAPRKTEPAAKPPAVPAVPSASPQPMRNGNHSLTRMLGAKVGRIVIDAGHGGHDTGTIGPTGLMEKDVCLDIALRLGKTIQEKLPGAEVVYTRTDDTFVPLERRTEIANQVRADLFISIHANSSRQPSARGVETYYLSFATSSDAMEVAARENATAQVAVHEMQDLIKKILNHEKVEESRELAVALQAGLSGRLQRYSRYVKNRGVKRAPFVVLVGAQMPSVLTEVSFLSNPTDERILKREDHRQRIVEGLFQGVENYLVSLNSLSSLAAKQPAAGDVQR